VRFLVIELTVNTALPFPETMNILITADLHYRLHWFRWLIEQAPDFDLVCIAGDLLDMFKSETRIEQAREVRSLIRELADIVPVAVCSGNHDIAGRTISHNRASIYKSFIQRRTHPNIISDGSTRKLENLIVTTIPYHCSRQENQSGSIDRGSTIRRQTGMPWIILHHVLPKKGAGVRGEEVEASELDGLYDHLVLKLAKE
jgi:predicted MPP superfamily phosphohydrolase